MNGLFIVVIPNVNEESPFACRDSSPLALNDRCVLYCNSERGTTEESFYKTSTVVNSNFLPSNNPLSLNLREGITNNAIKDKVI